MGEKQKWCLSTPSLTVAGKTLECVDNFTYLVSEISRDGSEQKDIKNRLSKAKNVFAYLRPIWRLSVYSIRTKLDLYNSIVKSKLLYWSECFSKFLKRIPIWLMHFKMNANAGSVGFLEPGPSQIWTTIKRRRLWWLRNILRMSHNRTQWVALRWTHQNKRKQDRPKATWSIIVEKEIKAMGLTWGIAEIAALNRIGWRQRVEVSCSVRS